MVNIKVTYGQVSHRFKISPSITWSTFESHLRSLFEIPVSTQITVSYTDEDGDVITLSSDLELLEVLSPTQQRDSGKLQNGDDALLKFALTVLNNENTGVDNNSWTFEGSTVHVKEGERVNLINDSDESSDDENYSNHVIYNDSEGGSGEDDDFPKITPLIELNDNERRVPINLENNQVSNNEGHTQTQGHVIESKEDTGEPTFEPTISSGRVSPNERQHQRKPIILQHETIGETSSSAFSPPSSSFNSNSNNAKQDEDHPPKIHNQEQNPEDDGDSDRLEDNFILLIPQLQRLPFFGPRFPFSHPLFSRHTRFSHRRRSPFDAKYGRFSHLETFRYQRRCIVGSIIKRILKTLLFIALFITLVKHAFIALGPLITIFVLWKGLACVKNFHRVRGYNRWRQGCDRCCCCQDEGSGEECEESGHSRRPFLNQGCGTCYQSPNCHMIPESDIKEKLEILKSMGFNVDEKKSEGLIKKFNGNMNKVVDGLLGQ